MSDSIDYDELDKAVAEAIKSKNTPKSSTPKSAAQPSVSHKSVVKNTTSTIQRPASRHQYMDFIGHAGAHKAAPKHVVKAPEEEKPRRVAHITKVNSVMPKYRTASRPVTNLQQKPAAKPVAKPAPSATKVAPAKVAAKPIAKPTAPKAAAPVAPKATPAAPKPAQKPAPVAQKPTAAPKPAAKPVEKKSLPPRGAATADPANLPGAVRPVVRAQKADAAENYSLGGSTPIINGAHIEKRPLGKGAPENPRDLRSTKNQYSSKSPLKSRHNDHHVVTEDPKKGSGWLWTLLVLLIVAAGAGLGYVAYLVVFAN